MLWTGDFRPVHVRYWCSPLNHLSAVLPLKHLAHHRLALGPQGLGPLAVQRIGANTAACGLVLGDFCHMAIFAKLSADISRRPHKSGPDLSLDEIAREAGVGIGTLYRHFPTRHAIVEAVYRREVELLSQSAARLLSEHGPSDALHAWMRLFINYVATKKLMYSALSVPVGGATPFASTGDTMIAAITLLVDTARDAGDIRPDAQAADVMRGLVGLTFGAAEPGWEASASRVVDILMDGLRR